MSLAKIYNSLPTIDAANSTFTGREVMFAKLAPLFAAYQFQFGACLVHAHCTIQEGEAMVAQGNVSRPLRGGPQHPERWLADGTPYEFSQEPTKAPPPGLIRDFQAVVGKGTVIGIFYHSENHDEKAVPDGKCWIEHTEGRENIMELVDKDKLPRHMETAWVPGTDDPLKMVCLVVCMEGSEGHTPAHT
ncbi:hypothetical protein V565_145570 [Rhizoctonia solani 123E]|uniref:Uncharacterized protein n=1 Tax=Rhizoctonia solani 123E TaxID=1423351 RepID=A0A074RLS5_9AGAM|nr:hypothetical protein V565_145570 [Rhizoctonia solani 123E]